VWRTRHGPCVARSTCGFNCRLVQATPGLGAAVYAAAPAQAFVVQGTGAVMRVVSHDGTD
jgi:hypothetical protein